MIMRCCIRAPKVFSRAGFESFSSLLAMKSTSPCTVPSPFLAMFASPDSAGGGLGRVRVVPRRGELFSLLSQKKCSDISSAYSSE